jgi:hypothetical protein
MDHWIKVSHLSMDDLDRMVRAYPQEVKEILDEIESEKKIKRIMEEEGE